MSPSLQTMGFFMSDINFCNTKEQLNHLGEVVTGKVDGSPTGADIDTSTLPYTGQVRKTLPALEVEYQKDIDNFNTAADQVITDKTAEFDASIASKESEADAAIDEYRLLNKGQYAAGITLESKFEYINYNGESYFAANPPYTTTVVTPDSDANLFVGAYQTQQNVIDTIESVTTTFFGDSYGSAVDNMIDGRVDGVVVAPTEVGKVYLAGSTPFLKVSSLGQGLLDFKPLAEINLLDAGLVGDGSTDNHSKVLWLIENTIIPNAARPNSPENYPFYVPSGENFYCSDTLYIKSVVHFRGDGTARFNTNVGRFTFPANKRGFVLEDGNTQNLVIISPVTTTSAGASLIGFAVYGSGGTFDYAGGYQHHGIMVKANAIIERMEIQGFAGDGVHGAGTVGSSDPLVKGNLNLSKFDTIRSHNNYGWGFSLIGSDANACHIDSVDCVYNGNGGYRNETQHGNLYSNCHASGNATKAAPGNNGVRAAMALYNSNYYVAALGATQQELVDTEPGTDEDIWRSSLTVSSGAMTWTSGLPVGSFFFGCSYYQKGLLPGNIYNCCYSESFAPGVWFELATVIGGTMENIQRGSSIQSTQTNCMRISPGLEVIGQSSNNGGDGGSRVDIGRYSGGYVDAMKFILRGMTGSWSLGYDRDSDVAMCYNSSRSSENIAFWLTQDNTTTRQSKKFRVEDFILGSSRKMGNWVATSLPSSGNWVRGDVYFYQTPTPNGKIGWTCTTSGVGGSTAVFKEFGQIES